MYEPPTRPSPIQAQRMDTFRMFLADVMSVDAPRKIVTLKDVHSGTVYQQVKLLPATHSSSEGTDMVMPEPNSRCLAVYIASGYGFHEVAVVTWVAHDTTRAEQAVAIRAVDTESLQGWNRRVRGNYRTAAPGEHTKTLSAGYTERHDDGWDRSSADHSRERLDPDTRTLATTTSRVLTYNDGGVTMEGPVERPGAANLASDTMPDHSTRQIAYLSPGAAAIDRYVSGKQDVLAFAERTHKTQEFALDFPVPIEAVGNGSLLDQVLGTTADPWGRTTIQTTSGISHDDQSYMISQAADSPTYTGSKFVGPTTQEGATPRRRGFILEESRGTFVGSNQFDKLTYGQVLKPTLFSPTSAGRFGTSLNSGYMPVVDSADHLESRLAASALSVRFPHESNTTRWDVTKEGMLLAEIGASIPKENIPLSGSYEYPHGAGRSVEAHLVGSMQMVIGKNRDEEDAIDLRALGQAVIRLGADDTGLPSQGRSVLTQKRSASDAVQPRTTQYWTSAKLTPGDAGDLANKTGAENVSLRGAFDGGAILRLGGRNASSRRRHLMNGYTDGPGVTQWSVSDAGRKDSRTDGRVTYGSGDSIYQFHDLTVAGKSQLNILPYSWSGAPVANMDAHGLSLDVHAVRDCLLRIGANPASGQSLLLDLAGAIVAGVGKDTLGRSVTATLDGGIEMTIGANSSGKGLRLEINGDVDWTIKGNFHMNVTGDTVFESTSHQHIAKTDFITKAQRHVRSSLANDVTESPSIVHNEGLYTSTI